MIEDTRCMKCSWHDGQIGEDPLLGCTYPVPLRYTASGNCCAWKPKLKREMHLWCIFAFAIICGIITAMLIVVLT